MAVKCVIDQYYIYIYSIWLLMTVIQMDKTDLGLVRIELKRSLACENNGLICKMSSRVNGEIKREKEREDSQGY